MKFFDKWWVVPALCAVAFVGVSSAAAQPCSILGSHTGSDDPVAVEGWVANGPANGMTVGPLDDGGTPVWELNDSSTAAGSTRFYSVTPTGGDNTAAASQGWTLSARLKVLGTNDPVDYSIAAAYNNGITEYSLAWGADSDGDPIVGVSTSLLVWMTYTVEGGAGSYHDYDLVYDPVAGSADLFVDGVEVLSDYMGFPRDLNRVLWGAGQSSSTGHAYWNKAWFGIGECRGGCCIGGGTPGTPAECIVTTQAICEAQNNLYLGDDQPCDEVDCYPLLVTMEAFSAEATKDGVLISWTTASEIDTAGFRVLRGVPARGEKAATLEPISPLIPSAGNSLESASYSFLDNAKQAATAEYYYIEDLDIFGKVTRHGPIVVERNQPSPRGWKVDLKR